jgi:NDP-sugar pyrophosphorylase family protein
MRTILIPAAGAGKRFKEVGISTPKPLITVNKKSLLEYTLECFQIKETDHLVIATQRNDNIRERFESICQNSNKYAHAHWVELDSIPSGQLATALAAINDFLQYVPDAKSNQLIIHNCDTGFNWSNSIEKIQGFASMPVFEAKGNHWSFGQEDPLEPIRAIRIAEKERISSLASIGLYCFISTDKFISKAKLQLDTGTKLNGEFYIAPMLQAAIEAGEYISIPRVDGVKLYGTPSELCETFSISFREFLSQNSN